MTDQEKSHHFNQEVSKEQHGQFGQKDGNKQNLSKENDPSKQFKGEQSSNTAYNTTESGKGSKSGSSSNENSNKK